MPRRWCVGPLALRHLMTEPYRIAVAERIRSILSTRNLTLYKASAFTRADHPGQSALSHSPQSLFSSSLPSLESYRSAVARAHATIWISLGRLACGVFGFRLDDVSRLQLCLRQPRTVRLDSTVYAVDERIPWFLDRSTSLAAPPIAPLSQLLEQAGFGTDRNLTTKGPSRYLYAKIGQQDAYAFPDLAPGSIVRVDTRFPGRSQRKANAELSKVSFLVEHRRGLCCCRLHFGAGNRITLRATELPFACPTLNCNLAPKHKSLAS